MTRILSGHFSLQDYGTYSQIMLLTTTVSSLTIFGMMDGINFFFCRESDRKRRDTYVSTIFFLQYVASAVSSAIVLICTVPISKYFGNDSLKPLVIFAAILPVLQNSISLLQLMFIAIGKAKMIAFRNLAVSVLKLVAICFACYVFDNIVILLICQMLTDAAQVVYFVISLRKNNCKINILKFDKSIIKEILFYCLPMAMFALIKSLNRDSDKFVISFFTNTETMAVYTNASKLLPFDIVMSSFCTVLLPYITRYIAQKRYDLAHSLYKSFLELSYMSTTILATGAICVAPELMRFLYTEKYASHSFSVIVFIIYILVDIFSVLNITLVLSAAGKTKTVMLASLGTFFANIILNISLFFVFGEVGPAVATLLVTVVQGVVLLSLSSKELKSNIFKMFDWKYFFIFFIEIIVVFTLSSIIRILMLNCNVPYVIILIVAYGIFCGALLLLNVRRFLRNLKSINQSKAES